MGRGGPQEVRCGPPTLLQLRLPSHSLHRPLVRLASKCSIGPGFSSRSSLSPGQRQGLPGTGLYRWVTLVQVLSGSWRGCRGPCWLVSDSGACSRVRASLGHIPLHSVSPGHGGQGVWCGQGSLVLAAIAGPGGVECGLLWLALPVAWEETAHAGPIELDGGVVWCVWRHFFWVQLSTCARSTRRLRVP